MFARKLAARARALEGRAGLVDLYLIRLRAAALTFAPDGPVIVAEGRPLARGDEASGGFGGGVVGG